MRKNYFEKSVSSMKNVYHVDHGLNKLSDGRVNLTYSTGQVILPVLFGFLLRFKSFNELNFMIKNNELTLLKIIRARWDIENSIFNNLKTECGLEHCFVHGGKAVEAVLDLIFIASNIMQLFLVRRLRNQFTTQRAIVRLLLKGLYLLKYRAELVFSSS